MNPRMLGAVAALITALTGFLALFIHSSGPFSGSAASAPQSSSSVVKPTPTPTPEVPELLPPTPFVDQLAVALHQQKGLEARLRHSYNNPRDKFAGHIEVSFDGIFLRTIENAYDISGHEYTHFSKLHVSKINAGWCLIAPNEVDIAPTIGGDPPPGDSNQLLIPFLTLDEESTYVSALSEASGKDIAKVLGACKRTK